MLCHRLLRLPRRLSRPELPGRRGVLGVGGRELRLELRQLGLLRGHLQP